METSTVHKLTHDFLLLDDDELSSESDSDSDGDAEGGGGDGGEEGRRRRNSTVDQVCVRYCVYLRGIGMHVR